MKQAGLSCGLVLGVAFLAGCVERRMTIVSDPPGALVVVNGKPIGAAPVDVPSDRFVYYGDYDITLLRDGFEPLLVHQAVPAPWYEWFPLDFFSENLVPWHIKDKRVFSYPLLPPTVITGDDLLQRAHSHRLQGQTIGSPFQPAVAPMPAIAPVPPAAETLPPPARLEAPVPGP